jgi:translation initiation factor IF-2
MASTTKTLKGSLRPPIVVVLGHVDHGKTTLLDAIRKTSVVAKEAGGITQSIGASVVTTKDGKDITFIDTPGHAAFSNMRSQGAKVADIAILVIAADDGFKPQTKEALEYILEAKVPFIVAATKTDLERASVEKIKGQLEKEGVMLEDRGGEVPLISVSGKTGKGLDELLEMITLLAELHSVKGSEDDALEAFVIETGKDKRGPFASLVVHNGKLSVGEEVVANRVTAKIRGIFDHLGKSVKEVGPGKPAQILGFSELPQVGARVWSFNTKNQILPEKFVPKKLVTKAQEGEIAVVIKAKNAGSLEALQKNLPNKIFVVNSSVGDVSESDVFVAKSAAADIYAFESTAPKSVSALADTEGVRIKTYKIIYELIEELEDLLEQKEVKIAGRAQILQSFPFNLKKVAGCKVVEGIIKSNDNLTLTRHDKEIGKVKIISMRKEKNEVGEVKQGEEFGVILSPQLEFETGDMLISVRK